jgi:glycerol kinase
MILAVDQGTASTCACLVAPDGCIVGQRAAEHRQILRAQSQVDELARDVASAEPEATALAAAFPAGRALGIWDADDALAPKITATFEPRISADQRSARLDRFARTWRAAGELGA